jgi:hypothetical protein
MSIEKLTDASKTYLESHPYAQIFNLVIEHIKDNDAYRLYSYLCSKSREWSVVKEWTAKVCGVGERKAKQCWAYLERCGLIEYMTVRDLKGKFIKHDIRVLNGTRFNPDEPFLKPTGAETAPMEKLSTDEDIHRCKNPPGGESTRVGFAPLLKKDITNKDFERNKDKSFCKNEQKKSKNDWRAENAKVHDFAESKNQMANEAEHIRKHEEIKRAPMPESLRSLIHGLKMVQ